MMKEHNPLIMSTAVDHMFKIAFDLAPEQRKTLELCMMDLLGENRTKECRQYVIRKLGSNATSPELLDKIYSIWQKHNDPLFNEQDYMNWAYRLAIVRGDTYHPVLAAQRKRLKTVSAVRTLPFVPNCSTRCSTLRTANKSPGH